MSAVRPLKRGTAGATPVSPQPCVGIRTYLRRHDYYMAMGMGEADGAIVERVLAGDRDAFGILIELPVVVSAPDALPALEVQTERARVEKGRPAEDPPMQWRSFRTLPDPRTSASAPAGRSQPTRGIETA
jgi:hypothetical protein